MLLLLLFGASFQPTPPLAPQGGGTSRSKKKKVLEPIWLQRIRAEQDHTADPVVEQPTPVAFEVTGAEGDIDGDLCRNIEQLRDKIATIPPPERIAIGRLRIVDDNDTIEADAGLGAVLAWASLTEDDDEFSGNATRNDDDIAIAALFNAAKADEEMLLGIIEEVQKHAKLQQTLRNAGLTVDDLRKHFAVRSLPDVDRSTVEKHSEFWGKKAETFT